MKIAIIGLFNSMLLAQHRDVVALDIMAEKVAMLNQKKAPSVCADLMRTLLKVSFRFNLILSDE